MATSYANSGGTGDRTASITQTARTGLFNGTATNLINGNTTENNFYFNSSITNGWVKWDFGAGAVKFISELKWYQSGASSQGTWKIQGSNDDSEWTDLSSTFSLGASATGVYYTFGPQSFGYRYYRLLQTAGATTNGPYIREAEFKIGDSADGVNTSYGNVGGSGDRASIITLTTSASLISTPSGIINGTYATGSWFNGGKTTGWLTFDFGEGAAKVIDEIQFRQSGAQSQGTWKFQGSDDDSNWTDLTEISDFGNQAATSVYAFTNITGYRYYRLYQTGGTTSGAPYFLEIEFKIADSVTSQPTGHCDLALFGGPYVVLDPDDGMETGSCTFALFGGPGVISNLTAGTMVVEAAIAEILLEGPAAVLNYEHVETVWQGPTSWGGDSAGLHQLRQVLPAANITASGNQIQLFCAGPSSGNTILVGCSIGQRDGSTDDFVGAPTRITFNNGDNGITYGSTGAWSDIITFDLDETKDHLIHFYVDTGSNHPYKSGGTVFYKLSGPDDTMETAVSYSVQSYTRVAGELDAMFGSMKFTANVAEIQVLGPAAVIDYQALAPGGLFFANG